MSIPRAFIVRHGETAWSLNGRHTGTSDIPLTKNGEARIRATGKALVGDDRLIVPGGVAHIYVSPRARALRTLTLLDIGCRDAHFPSDPSSPNASDPPIPGPDSIRSPAKVQITDAIREWDYGDYEGKTSSEIQAERRERGEGEWDIWRDGCPGGESPEDITSRLDALIADIRSRFHAPALASNHPSTASPPPKPPPADVLLVAHGHILRAFAMRWIGRGLGEGVSLLLEAGGVGTLSYEHRRVEEPAILLGGAFVV